MAKRAGNDKRIVFIRRTFMDGKSLLQFSGKAKRKKVMSLMEKVDLVASEINSMPLLPEFENTSLDKGVFLIIDAADLDRVIEEIKRQGFIISMLEPLEIGTVVEFVRYYSTFLLGFEYGRIHTIDEEDEQ